MPRPPHRRRGEGTLLDSIRDTVLTAVPATNYLEQHGINSKRLESSRGVCLVS